MQYILEMLCINFNRILAIGVTEQNSSLVISKYFAKNFVFHDESSYQGTKVKVVTYVQHWKPFLCVYEICYLKTTETAIHSCA